MRIAFENRAAFRTWLLSNFESSGPVWIEFYKDGRKSISYQESLEEALCFGWIDSLIKKVDEVVYLRKFSRRKKNSNWSEINKALIQELTSKGLMTTPGEESVFEAKQTGRWNKADERVNYTDITGLRTVLTGKIDNINDFDVLSESLKNHYSLVYFSAKRETTRNKRLEMIIEYMKTRKRFLI